KKYSQDPATAAEGGNLGWIQQGGGLPKAFEDQVFAMQKAGDISGVLTTEYGYQIIKLNKIQDKGSFEQDRPMLEADLKMKKAQESFTKAREELAAAAFDHPDSLKQAADKLGLKIVSIDEWITRKEADTQVAEQKLSADFVKALFSDDVLKKKRNSEPVAVSENTVAVVRASDVRAASQQSFEQAKEQVRFDYLRTQAEKMAQEKAKQALVDLQTGEKVDLKWSPQEKLTAAQAGQSLPPQAYQSLLKARPNENKPVYFLVEGLPVPVLIAVDAVLPPENIEAQLPQAKQMLLNAETNTVFAGLMSYLQTRVPVEQGSQKLENQ
ncbi:peptidylprolyl isomerase, partial [Neisseria weixii]|uniref:peptidylprolyl isomerase n=1 Tax=Neisseria weixii TaxID=1853276 RepID=UPI00359F9A7E